MKRLPWLLAGFLLAVAAVAPAYADPGDMTTGLVACWNMDEASGVRYDSWGGYHWTALNNPGSAAGVVGQAATFNAEDLQKLTQPGVEALKPTTTFTWAGWVRFDAIDIGTDSILSQTQATGSTSSFFIERFGSYIRAAIYFGSGVVVSTSTVELIAGQWYFFVFGWNSSLNNLFVSVDNEMTVNSTALGVNNLIDVNFNVGHRVLSGNPRLNGRVDQMLFTRDIWTADQRTWLYNSGNGRSCADIIATGGGPPPPTATPDPVAPPPIAAAYYEYEIPSGGNAIYRLEATSGDAAIIGLLLFILTATLFTVIQRTARASSARSGG